MTQISSSNSDKNDSNIHAGTLFEFHEMGFKLVPSGEDCRAVEYWTPILSHVRSDVAIPTLEGGKM